MAVAAVLFVTAGCGSAPGSGPFTAAASSSRSDTATSGARNTFPAAVPSLVAPPAGAVCRIPYAEISEASGGFIYYPGGVSQPDPASEVALPGNTPGTIGVNPGLSYVPSLGRWFPVPLFWVVPTSSFYLYQANGAITEVWFDGRTVPVLNGAQWSIVGATDAGIYVAQNGPGAYWLQFGGQGPSQIVDHGTWFRYAFGSLWGVDGGYLARYDVGTGFETHWGQMSEQNWIPGFDGAGEPIVNVGGALILHHADGSTTTIWPGTNGLSAAGYVFGDEIGVEFAVGGGLVGAPGHGIYTWTSTGGAKQTSTYEANVVGPCGS